METSYKDVSKVSSEVWPEVLTTLSARGEWVAIRNLVLGIDFQFINGSAVVDGISVKICNVTRIFYFISLIFKDISSFFCLQFQSSRNINISESNLFKLINHAVAFTVLSANDPQGGGERCGFSGNHLQHTVPVPREPRRSHLLKSLDHPSGTVSHHTGGRLWNLIEVPSIGRRHTFFCCR